MTNLDLGKRRLLKTSALSAFSLAIASTQAAFSQKLEVAPKSSGKSLLYREDYLLDPSVTYFNHASIGTVPKLIHNAQKDYLSLCESNPWLYMWSSPWQTALAETRSKLSSFIGCDANELVLTHNTTEGFNLLAQGLKLNPGDEVVFSDLNHDGAGQCWLIHGKRRSYQTRVFSFPKADITSLTDEDIVEIYKGQITPKTRVLVIPHIDNIVGLRHPIKKIATMARSQGVDFIAVDGAQAIGMLPVNVGDLGVDFYGASPHKWLQAPKGTGLLYIKKSQQDKLEPMWVTWGQKKYQGTHRVFEDYGTRNLAEVLCLSHSVELQEKIGQANAVAKRQKLWRHAQELCAENKKIAWRSPQHWNQASALCAIEIKQANSRFLAKSLFENHGYVLRPFSGDWNTLRLSFNTMNTTREIDRLFQILTSLV